MSSGAFTISVALLLDFQDVVPQGSTAGDEHPLCILKACFHLVLGELGAQGSLAPLVVNGQSLV